MIRNYEPVAILRHPRVRALSAPAQTAYLALLSNATPSGHVLDADLDRHLALLGRAAVTAVWRAGLLGEEPTAPGYWIVLPTALDAAVMLPVDRDRWARDAGAVVIQLADRLPVSADEWSAAMDARGMPAN